MDPTPQIHEIRVRPESEGQRLDVWVSEQIEDLSRSRAQKLLERGLVRVDGQACPARHRVRAGESVRVELPPVEPVSMEPDPSVPFRILYEDADLAVIDKPVGVVVHPAPGHRSGTLVHGLLARLDALSGVGGRARPGLVHRLDRDTSGLLVVAKNDAAHHHLQDQLRRRTLRRVYRALVWGAPGEESGRIDLPLDRDPNDRKRRAVVEGGRRAVTLYRAEERGEGASRLRLELRTGRTHQIRVHLAHRGHPVLGDEVYGGDRKRLRGAAPQHRLALAAALKELEGQALHASVLLFAHPRDGRTMRWRSPLREDIARAWAHLRTPRFADGNG